MKKMMFGLLMAISAMFVLTSCGGGADQSSPKAVVESYTKAMIAENYEDALALCCNAEKKALTSDEIKQQAESMKSMAKMAKEMGGEEKSVVKSVEVVDEKVEGEEATVKTKETKDDGSTKDGSYTCYQIDGKWYVLGGK